MTKYLDAEPFNATGWLVNGTVDAPGPAHTFLTRVGQTPVLFEFTSLMVPLGETLIGLGPVVGTTVRLATAGGMFPMTFSYLDSTERGHGLVNGDLLGFAMFLVVGVLATGCVLGLDVYLGGTEFIRQRPKLRYLRG